LFTIGRGKDSLGSRETKLRGDGRKSEVNRWEKFCQKNIWENTFLTTLCPTGHSSVIYISLRFVLGPLEYITCVKSYRINILHIRLRIQIKNVAVSDQKRIKIIAYIYATRHNFHNCKQYIYIYITIQSGKSLKMTYMKLVVVNSIASRQTP
jgi:hypothetical protein